MRKYLVLTILFWTTILFGSTVEIRDEGKLYLYNSGDANSVGFLLDVLTADYLYYWPTTTPSDGDVNHLSSADQIYDFVIASLINYLDSSTVLDDLADVNAPSPNDDDVLTWDDAAGEWVAVASSAGSETDPCAMQYLDQSVKIAASPTFANLTVAGAINNLTVTAGKLNKNVAIGYLAGDVNTSGAAGNTIIGREVAKNLDGDSLDITAIGRWAGYNITSGDYHTLIGEAAGFNLTTANAGVFIGYAAGYYETASNKLFIDNALRANQADGRIKALIYGVFAASPANQVLTFNAKVGVGTITPDYELDVIGDVNCSGDFYVNGVALTNGAETDPCYALLSVVDLLTFSANVLDVNTATITNGDTKHLATGDQIYDFVTGLGYITANQTITLSGDVTGSGTTSIATNIANNTVGPNEIISTAVTPGAYTNTNLTVDVDGRITLAANGSGGGISWSTAPDGATSSGTAGDVAYDSSFFYVAVANDSWKRVALSTLVNYLLLPTGDKILLSTGDKLLKSP